MANSTIKLADIVQFAKTFPDIAPIVQSAAGGSSLQPALTIASDVMIEMISQAFNWKWNRFKLPLFYTNSWQQDYALNVVNLGWLEHGFLLDINNNAQPKPIWPLEVVKDLEATSAQYGRPGQVCWLPNDQLYYAEWPGPNTVISSPLNVTAQPANPITQIVDSNGNFWVVSTYGTTGSSEPTWPTSIEYPTQTDPNASPTTVTDGTVVWTAINPKGQGIRCNPLPSQTGTVYQFNLIGQYRPFAFSNGPFTSFSQTIEPVPDDFSKYFRDGFIAMAYSHSPDKAIRGKFQDQYNLWRNALINAKIQGDRERDNSGFYPSIPITSQGPFAVYPGPAWPYQFPW